MIDSDIPGRDPASFGSLSKLDPTDINADGTPDLLQHEISAGDIGSYPLPDAPRKKFKHTLVGRFLTDTITAILIDTITAKNIPGRVAYGLLGIGGIASGSGMLQNLIPTINKSIMSFDLMDLGIAVVMMVLTFLTSRGLIKGLLKDMAAELQQAARALKQARAADSPGGKEITPEEKKELLKEADDILTLIWRRLLRNKVAKLFGIDFSQEQKTNI